MSAFAPLRELQRSAATLPTKNTIKKPLIWTYTLCQPGSTLSPPISASASRSPPFSPTLVVAVVFSVAASLVEPRALCLSSVRGGSWQRRRCTSHSLSLIPSSAPTDTQTLGTVRSSSLSQPKKRDARTQGGGEKGADDRNNKEPSRAVSTEEARNCTTGRVQIFPSSRA